MKNRFSQIIAFIQLSLLLSSNVFAEVVVDLTAAANKQAQLKQAANGMTYVNIQAPNSSGLSHNVYTKFNVDPVGLVLNNSVGDANTKLVGWIEGNTLLGGKSAKTILNEVNSNSPSTLRGFIEVAGSKANVIVANPNGIMVDGAGFINVNRGVLTTGAPVITDGDLTGYRVTDGHISIDGLGMDASGSDYTDIISRTAALNSKIWANNLNIIAGTNDVSFDTKSVTSSDSASKPVYAIDTGALGGMYAGKIRLVATEAGVGVRNNGEISAGSELTISVNGKLENASKIYSAGTISTSSSSDTVNTGTMYSIGDTNIDTNATINNSGLIAAYGNLSVKANTISNKVGATMAAGLDENVTISKATSTLGLKAALIDNRSDLLASNISIGDGSGTIDNTGTINAANTYINVQNLNNKAGGKIYGDNVALQVANLTNYSVIASRGELNIGATDILNKDGALIYSLENMYIGGALDANKLATGKGATLTNSSATIESMGGMYLASQSITNTNNNFAYEWIVDYVLTGQSKSLGGSSYANYTETHYKPNITQTAPAKMLSAGDMILDAGSVVNYQSEILSGGNMTITAGSVDNQAIAANQPITQSGTQYIHQKTGEKCHTNLTGRHCRDEWGHVAYGYGATYYEAITIDNATRQSNTNNTSLKTIDNSGVVVTPSAITTINPDPTAKYLIETDPKFADQGKWLSSDFMLSKLSYDPASQTKRLGDGFYEQKLIQEQIGQLTGRRFINGYNDDNTQFQALMNNAINQASSLSLKVGASLSAAQVAALSSDIVWMVEKTMTLPDGTTQKVLTPQVYLASNSVSLTPQGALISANNVSISAAETLSNSGVIKSGNATYVLAKDVTNTLGEIGSGGTLAIASANSIANTQGTFSSKGDISLSAGRDISINGANITSGGNATLAADNNINMSTIKTNKSYATIRETNNIASNITVANALNTTSGADTTINAANITANAANITALSGNVNIGSVKDVRASDYEAKNHSFHSVNETIKGTTINTKGNLNIVAANTANKTNAGNIVVSSSTLDSANGATNLTSAKDTTITGDKELHSEYDKKKSSSSGFFSSKTTTTTTNRVSNTQMGSSVSGDSVNIATNQSINIIGSNVVATKDVNLAANNNINITAATNDYIDQSFTETKKSGLLTGGGGIGITIGTQTVSMSRDTQGYTQSDAKSTVGSIEGNVNIASNKEVTIKGSDIVAPKDLTISGSNVTVSTGVDTLNQTEVQKVKQSGVTIALTGSVVAAVQTAQAMQQASKKAKSSRMSALAATSTALAASNAVSDASKLSSSSFTQAAPDNNAKDSGAVGVSITYGESKSESKSTTNATTNTASNLSSGRDTIITASSTDKDKGNIEVSGSNVSSNKDVILTASNNINLVSAQDTFDNKTNSNSSSWGAGVAITFGSNGMAFGVTGNASAGKGKANETTLTNQNTHINANNAITINSGNDTNIKGAVVSADSVKANIGGNLSLESLQDTSTYKSSSQSAGGSVTVGYGASGSASYSQANAKSDYKSVNEQSAIKTKDGGFDIKVAGNTDLKGAVIESSDKAIDGNKNSLTTATLTTSDISNKAQYSASSISVGISGGGSTMAGMGGYADDKGDASSTTKSAISKSNINITNEDKQKALTGKDAKDTVASINTDTKNAHTKLEKIFNKDEVEGKVQASAEIIQSFNQNASRFASDYVSSKIKTSQDNAAKAQSSQDGKFEGKTAEQWNAEAKSWNGEKQAAINMAIAMFGGSPGSVLSTATKETLRLGSIEMRDQMIADSEKFKGIKDSNGNVLSNISGESVGVDGDGKKIAGGRIDLNNKELNAILAKDDKGNIVTDSDGYVKLKDSSITVADIPKLASTTISPLGGIQGSQGYIFGIPYSKGGIVDKVVESYAGPHDWLNSGRWYGSDGNIKSGMSSADKTIGEATNYANVAVATPFAASRLIPPDVWEAIRVLTTVVK